MSPLRCTRTRSMDGRRTVTGSRSRAPFDSIGPATEVNPRVIPWDNVSLDEGTGIVHIAPGCGVDDFDLGKAHGLEVLAPVDEAGRFYSGFGWLSSLSVSAVTDRIIDYLRERALLVDAATVTHR